MESKPLRKLVPGQHMKAVRSAVVERADDIRRMKACLYAKGYEASGADLASVWLSYSEAAAVEWLDLPSVDQRLFSILVEGQAPLLVSASTRYPSCKASLIDTSDGTGDQILQLPDILMATLGWSVNDVLEVSSLPNGDVRLHKISGSA